MSSTLRELDHRTNDGIDVRMLWDAVEDRVTIAVSDARTGEAFTVPVAPGVRAYEVFHHPYAYAGDAPRRASGDLTPTGP
jgi:hypothetical protein